MAARRVTRTGEDLEVLDIGHRVGQLNRTYSSWPDSTSSAGRFESAIDLAAQNFAAPTQEARVCNVWEANEASPDGDSRLRAVTPRGRRTCLVPVAGSVKLENHPAR